MRNDITKTAAQAHVKGFVTSYAKCWEHYQGYMQDPSKTIEGFRQECQEEADEQGVDIKLPAIRTFENRTAKLKQAGVIPARLKSDKPEAVKKRKQREGTNPQVGEMSPTDDSQSSSTQSLPENSDESPVIECNSNSPITPSVVEPALRQSDGGQPKWSQVSDVSARLVPCEEEQDADPMDTRPYDPNDASEKFDRIEQLIRDIEDIHRELFEGGLSEGQWQDLSQQYGALQYFADIRWQRRRMEMERRRGEFNRLLDEASMGVSPSTSEVPQLD